jgi:hypothetical protein
MVATTVAEFLRKTKKSSTEASVETIEMLAKHAEFVESLHDLLHNGLDIQQNFAIGYYLHRLDLARRDQKKVWHCFITIVTQHSTLWVPYLVLF